MADHQHQSTVDISTLADHEVLPGAPQAGDGAGGCMGSEGIQDLQNIRLVLDIGDRTIEIPLRGSLILRTENNGPQTTTDRAQQGQSMATNADEQAKDDKQFLDQMRGWLMTVAALFVNMAFQAAMQPPAWMPTDLFRLFFNGTQLRFSGARGVMARLYMLADMFTFAIALVLLVVLLLMKKSPPTRAVKVVTRMMAALASTVALAFAFGAAAENFGVLGFVVAVLLLCATKAIEFVPSDGF